MPMDKKPCKKVLRRFNHSRIWILLNGGNDINTCYHSVYSLQSLPLNPMKWHHVLVNIYFLSDASFGSPCLLTHVSCHHAHDSRDLILMCPISPCAMLSDGSQTMTHPHCWELQQIRPTRERHVSIKKFQSILPCRLPRQWLWCLSQRPYCFPWNHWTVKTGGPTLHFSILDSTTAAATEVYCTNFGH